MTNDCNLAAGICLARSVRIMPGHTALTRTGARSITHFSWKGIFAAMAKCAAQIA